MPHSFGDAAVLPLHPEKLGKACLQAELVGVRVVDPGQERLGDALKVLLAKTAAYEAAKRLVIVALPRRDRSFLQCSQTPGPRKQGGRQQRIGIRRRKQGKSRRQIDWPAGMPERRWPVRRFDGNQLILHSQLEAQLAGPGFGRKDRVGPELDDELAGVMVDDLGADAPASAVGGFQRDHGEVGTCLPQPPGNGQSGHPAPDNDDVLAFAHRT